MQHTRLVSPFVVSRPDWLTGDAEPPARLMPPWEQRKLIFFAGHVPKTYIRDTRYMLWRSLRNDPRVTSHSPDLLCTVGGYAEACRLPEPVLEAQNASYYATFCRHACDARTICLGSASTDPSAARTARLREALRRRCADGFVGVDFSVAELADMRRDTVPRLPHEAYLAQAAAHKFCLIAPGDFTSTHKLSEAMALGGAGGCIPLIVLPVVSGSPIDGRLVDVRRKLPFTRWLDYCDVSYLIPEARARSSMPAILDELAARPAAEIDAKRAALRRVRDAFAFRKTSTSFQERAESTGASTSTRPMSADYIFAEACEAARHAKRLESSPRARPPPPLPVRGGDHRRCVLMGDGVTSWRRGGRGRVRMGMQREGDRRQHRAISLPHAPGIGPWAASRVLVWRCGFEHDFS